MIENDNKAPNANENTAPTSNADVGGDLPSPPLTATPGERTDPKSTDRKWYWLTFIQYMQIFIVTSTFVAVLAYGSWVAIKDLGSIEVARGLITFVITVATVAIAMMLTITAIVTREYDKRIAVGKEIFTVLVGVLGTIVGFYYGASETTERERSNANAQAAQISSAPVTIAPPQLTANAVATLSTKLSGGTPPYVYSIRFTPGTIPAVENQESANGEINHRFTASVPTGTDIGFVIEGKDKNGAPFEINKDGKQKIPVR